MEFVGREKERGKLGAFADRREPAVAVIYGRRRIGKSLLIRQILKDREALFFEALENRSTKDQISHFIFQLNHQTGAGVSASTISSWKEAFLALFKLIQKRSCLIVFDEFQWMANYRHEIVSDLKYVWDNFFYTLPKQKLILCGSVASFMINKVIKSSAFYGRIDTQLGLQGFQLHDSQKILTGKGVDEVVEAQMFTGGVPKYLQLLRNYPSMQLAMEDLAFTPEGYFTTEFDRIFISHFGRNADFEAIVKTLSEFPLGLFRNQLVKKARLSSGGQLTSHLQDLESAGFIRSTTPFNKGETSRQINYFLSDAYLRFYFSFIQPNLRKIHSGQLSNMFSKITQSGAYHAWMGRSFEYLCLQHANVISRILGFQGIDFSIGPYFQSPRDGNSGIQIDLIFNRTDNVLTVCEMKYTRRPVGKEIIAEMERKVEVLQAIAPKKTIQRVLIVRDKPTTDLLSSSYFYKIIEVDQLFDSA